MSETVLLTLLMPAHLADTCIEVLLEHPAAPPFTSVPGRGHGDDPATMTLAEQVSGWRRESRIEVRIDAADRTALLAALRDRMPTAAVRWRVTPIIAFGTLAVPAGDTGHGQA